MYLKSELGKRLARILMVSLLMFVLGFVSMERLKFLNTKENALILAEYLNARNSIEVNDPLDYEDILFLEEHVFGRWRFSKKITSSLSSIGEEEMKNIQIVYSEDFVGAEGYSQNIFSRAEDAFWYTKYNGNQRVNLPVYHIVRDGVEVDWQLEPFVKDLEIVQVYYDLGYNANYLPSVRETLPFLGIYVDTNNVNNLYLSFCGLWEMERILDDEREGKYFEDIHR